MSEEEIDLSDLPELDEDWFRRARYVEPGAEYVNQFVMTVPGKVRDWFNEAPEGRDAAVLAALVEYIRRHQRPQTDSHRASPL